MSIGLENFHSIFQKEGEPYYCGIFSFDEDEFNNWIASNFHEFGSISSFNEVAPSRETVKGFLSKGYKHKESQCHYSAKAINLLNADYEYCTGFIRRCTFPYPIVTHSFNLYKNNIIDFARLDNNLETMKLDNPSFPHTYYGIKIPNDFVNKFAKETFNECLMKPLLSEWYKNIKPYC